MLPLSLRKISPRLRQHWTVVCSKRWLSEFTNGTEALMMTTIVPQPDASAAGVRSSYILQRMENANVPIHLASPQDQHEDSTLKLINKIPLLNYHHLPVNDTKGASEIFQPILDRSAGLIVFFDRFYSEEMNSFRFCEAENTSTLLVLDMQDFHALRYHRRRDNSGSLPGASDDLLQRELASIFRCDLTLVCSPYELDILTNHYGIPANKLCLAPLFGDMPTSIPSTSFDEREDFVFIGGFRHEPNVVAVRRLKALWPRIRSRVGNGVQLHIFGAYCPPSLQAELHDPQNAFLMHGYVPSVESVLCKKRVLLSPLAFGAGIKGKHVEAWKVGLPIVTTSIGSEGMEDHGAFGGIVADDDDSFVDASESLYTDSSVWNKARSKIPSLLQPLCGQWNRVACRIAEVMLNIDERRKRDYFRSILLRESLRSTKYFSKYLEWKNAT